MSLGPEVSAPQIAPQFGGIVGPFQSIASQLQNFLGNGSRFGTGSSGADLFNFDFSKFNEDGSLGNDTEMKKFNKSFFHRFEDVQGLSLNARRNKKEAILNNQKKDKALVEEQMR